LSSADITPQPRDRISNYGEFRRGLNDRRRELGLSMLAVDGLAWLPLGYASKILSSPLKKGANFNRNIGHESMGKVLHALRLTISLVRDDESQAPGDEDSDLLEQARDAAVLDRANAAFLADLHRHHAPLQSIQLKERSTVPVSRGAQASGSVAWAFSSYSDRRR
jgi:hypothetical protein